MRTLVTDEQLGDLVRNWQTWNPDQRPSETRPAWRDRKRRQRERENDPWRCAADTADPAAKQRAWAATNFPGVPFSTVNRIGGELAGRGESISVQAVRDTLDREQAASDNQIPLGERGTGIRRAS
jgi:hypothetical protein